jgi:hypothetical protein
MGLMAATEATHFLVQKSETVLYSRYHRLMKFFNEHKKLRNINLLKTNPEHLLNYFSRTYRKKSFDENEQDIVKLIQALMSSEIPDSNYQFYLAVDKKPVIILIKLFLLYTSEKRHFEKLV